MGLNTYINIFCLNLKITLCVFFIAGDISSPGGVRQPYKFSGEKKYSSRKRSSSKASKDSLLLNVVIVRHLVH